MKTKATEWSPDDIADGILTWHTWPGFQGAHCRECQCKMNVMGMSYNHKCPNCDPNNKNYVMCSMHNHGFMPFDNPEFGPTKKTILAGGRRAMKISENQREHAIGTRVMLHEYWYGRACPVTVGTIVEWDIEHSYPGMRYYRVDVDGGRKSDLTLESNMAPFRKFADGEAVLIQHEDNWAYAKIVGLVDNEKAHFLYRSHRYNVEMIKSSMVYFVREENIRSPEAANPKCRWCKGKGKIVLATTIQKCLDCWPQ